MRKLLVAIVVMALVGGGIVGGAFVYKSKRESAATFLTDGASIHVAAGEAAKRRVLWTPPEALAETVNTSQDEYEPFLSADAQTMLFVRGKAGGGADIYLSRRTPSRRMLDGWSDPSPVSVNTENFDELGPAFSRDGNTIYFYSDRPGGLGGYDIWAADRLESGAWGAARNLGTAINSAFNDYGPTLSPDGSRLLFASNRPTAEELAEIDEDAWAATLREDVYSADYDLYESRVGDRGLGRARAIEALNTGAHDGSPAFSPGGDFLYFASKREGGYGGYDLYRVRLAAEGEIDLAAHPVEHLSAGVNTAHNELDPVVSQLGFELHFSSDRLAVIGGTEGEGSYDLFASVSREVYESIEAPAFDWAGLWSLVWPNLLWLLLLLLLLVLLFLLLRNKSMQDRYRRLSLLAKCLLISMLVHLLLLSVIGAYRLGTVLGEVMDRSGASRVALTTREGASDVARQVRGSLTQVEVRQASFESLATPMELPRLELPREVREFAMDRSAASDARLERAEAEEAAARRAELELREENREVELAQARERAAVPDAPTPDAPAEETRGEVSEARVEARRASSDVALEAELASPAAVEVAQSAELADDAAFEAPSASEAQPRELETAEPEAVLAERPAEADVDGPREAVASDVRSERDVEVAEARPASVRDERAVAVDATAEQATEVALEQSEAAEPLTTLAERQAAGDARAVETAVKIARGVELSALSDADAPAVDGSTMEVERTEVAPERLARISEQSPSAVRAEAVEVVEASGPRVEQARISPELALPSVDALALASPEVEDAGTPHSKVEPMAVAEVEPISLDNAPEIDSDGLELARTDVEPERFVEIASRSPSAVRHESLEPMVGAPASGSAAAELMPEFEEAGVEALALPAMSAAASDARPDARADGFDVVREAEVDPLDEPEVSVAGLDAGQDEAVDGAASEAGLDVVDAVVASEAPRAASRVEIAQGQIEEPEFGEFGIGSVEVETGSIAAAQRAGESSVAQSAVSEIAVESFVPAVDALGGEIALSDETLASDEAMREPAASEATLSMADAPVVESEVVRAPERVIEAPASVEETSIVRGSVAPTPAVELVPLADVAVFDGGESLTLPAMAAVGVAVDAPARIVEDASLTLEVPSELAAVPRAYRQRAEEFRVELIDELGGSEETELGVEAALAWLARHQDLTGHWSGTAFDEDCEACEGDSRLENEAALTGLSTLAFVGADHTHLRRGPYRDAMRRAVDWIVRSQDEAGDLSRGDGIYAHAIATTALAEMLAMTGDPALVGPVQKAASFIVDRIEGDPSGWQGEVGAIGDTSAIGWQVMALVSARRAGAEVPDAAFDAARDWIDRLGFPGDPGVYAHAPGEDPSRWATGEAMFSHRLLGRGRDDDRMLRSAEVIGSIDPDWDGQESTFQWYVTTMALYQHQGRIWNGWNEELIDQLLDHQEQRGHEAGSWDVRDRNSLVAGRVYQTAMNTLLLEVYYRYLPGFMDLDAADTGVVRGRVFDGRTGEALVGALVRLDLPDRPPQIVVTGDRGRYTLRPEDVPDHVAITATMEGYLPGSVNVPTEQLLRGVVERDIELFPQVAGVLALEAQPEVHHLGNNEFSGRINSQFQREAEGLVYERTFVLDRGLLRMAQERAEVRLLHKGTQAPNPVRINGNRLSQRLVDSPRDGSFGEWRATFPARWLVEGENVLEIRSVRGNSDLDDFEFVNVRVVLDPGGQDDRR